MGVGGRSDRASVPDIQAGWVTAGYGAAFVQQELAECGEQGLVELMEEADFEESLQGLSEMKAEAEDPD